MKKLISCCFLFISLAASSQTLSYTTFEDEEDAMPSTVLESNSTERDKTISLDSRKAILSNRANRLLKKADELFDMMWYAEAAKYYEQGLKKINGIPSKHILQRAGDAQYYTSNMERAHFWYGLLYENYKNELSADHIFKYAHALKGNSKYGKAKRMMRLYRKVHAVAPGHSKREKVLETILGTSQEAEIKNMAINSKYSEFSPMFFNQDKIVYASAKDSGFLTTRRYKWNNQPYLDLYVARINKTSLDLKGQKKFSKKVNTKYHEASVTFSPDGQTMYFTRNNSNGKRVVWGEKKVNHLKIYKSVLVNGEWSEAMELPFNSNEYSTGHPALSPDGKLLYFVSDRPGSMGKTDIFVVDVLENGNFSAPRNLGPEVNTGEREMFPFVNNEKLYFSSDGHTGLGGLDIFQAMYEN
ncbi:MAG: cell envelope biogenesis protein OmpA, partial [Bacteroidota bacterium]